MACHKEIEEPVKRPSFPIDGDVKSLLEDKDTNTTVEILGVPYIVTIGCLLRVPHLKEVVPGKTLLLNRVKALENLTARLEGHYLPFAVKATVLSVDYDKEVITKRRSKRGGEKVKEGRNRWSIIRVNGVQELKSQSER